MGQVEPTIKQLIAILGGWTVISTAAIAWATKLVNERIFSKWRKDEQSALEVVRHSLSSERVLLESAIRGSQQGQDLSHEKRLAAIERMWSAVLKLRATADGMRYFFGILLPSEYDLIFSGKQDSFAASIANINDEFVTGAMKAIDDVELDRPYLGEILWLRFFIYRAFVGRLGYLISRGKERRHIADWRDDKGIRQILAGALPQSTINSLLDKQKFSSIYTVFSHPRCPDPIVLEQWFMSILSECIEDPSALPDSGKDVSEGTFTLIPTCLRLDIPIEGRAESAVNRALATEINSLAHLLCADVFQIAGNRH